MTISGKGIGGFVGGQLTIVLDITEVLICVAIFGALTGSAVFSVKMLHGKKWEMLLLQEKEVIMQQMKITDGQDNNNFTRKRIPYEIDYLTSSL